MKIIKTYDWMRRDFSATMKCEGCGHQQENKSCYDDRNYYDNVVPTIKCNSCGKSANELGVQQESRATKYHPSSLI